MNIPDQRLTNIRVPLSLLADPTGFGGLAEGDYLRGDLILRDGRAAHLQPPTGSAPPRLVLPRLTEVHVHLDKCHTVDRLPAVGGDLRAAIEAQGRDKANWTAEDLRARAERGLQELIAAGCAQVRSHVDWPGGEAAVEPPLAWQVLKELAQDYRDRITLQLAPLVALADLARPETGQAIAREVALVGGALGSFVLDQPDRPQGIAAAVALAQAHDIALDFHVDEGLAPGLDGLQLIARAVSKAGLQQPVLCGHACSLMNLDGQALQETLDLVGQAELHVVTLPGTNLYLQGRRQGTPDRRGLTRLHELRAAGVPVLVGTDNVRDAFCPIGRHDPRAALALAVLAGHLDPPLARLWPMICGSAANALGLRPLTVEGARPQDLLICDAPSSSEALTGAMPLHPLTDAIMQGAAR